MFFRVKKIKEKEYAYIVKNEWKGKGSRQKVKGYAGRVYRFGLQNDVGFQEYFKISDIQAYIEDNGKSKIFNDLIAWELFKFGISREEFLLESNPVRIKKGKKNVVLLLNDGFMCSLTLRSLLDFSPEGDEQADGYRLARAFVEAGIKVPQAVFVGIFNKLYKKIDSQTSDG